MPSTQYLQVPQALPHRKIRSRSRSRSHEAVPVDEVLVSTYKERPRVHSPPIANLQLHSKPASIDGYTPRYSLMNGKPNGYCMGYNSQPKTYHGIEEDLNGDMYSYSIRDCATPPPPEPQLRKRIIGAWKLESYIAYPTPDSTIQRPTYPMTKNVTGFIMYTPDGYMSAQMLIPGQQSFKRGEGEEPQWAEAGKRCFAYCGPYYISNEGPGREEVLRHTFQVCNLPGWIGDVQIRTHRFEENGQVLVLGSEEPTEIKGDKRIPVLKWRRARDNTHSTPPAPTPQIRVSGPGEP